MARDNGKRGSYRHVSGSLAKLAAEHIERENATKPVVSSPLASSPIPNSPTDSNDSPSLPTNFKNLKRDKIDHLGVLGDNFFDSVPSSLNAKYPSMAVPGSMPRYRMSPQQLEVGRNLPPTWNEMLFAGGLWIFAFFGFLFTMYSGFGGIVAFLWALVAQLFGFGG